MTDETEKEARERLSRMLSEITKNVTGAGDYSESESEYETDEEVATASGSNSNSNPDKDTPANAEAQGEPATDGQTDQDKPKKKRKKKKKSGKKLDLEDLLNEIDLTDDLKDDPFNISRPVAERVEIAITKFRKNRKFTDERNRIFSSYLAYGGIQSGQKSFQGGGLSNGGVDENGEPDFAAVEAGVDLVEEPDDGSQIDFTNVVTTFLSQHFLKYSGWVTMGYHQEAPVVISAFLKYFLTRDVLPEYETDLRAAVEVAEKAKIELPCCKVVNMALPSRFDKACMLLFQRSWSGFFEGGAWQQSAAVETLGMDLEFAERIVQSVLKSNNNVNNNSEPVSWKSITSDSRRFMDLEVVEVNIPQGRQETPTQGSSVLPTDSFEAADAENIIDSMIDRAIKESTDSTTLASGQDSQEKKDGVDVTSGGEQSWPVPTFARVILAELEQDPVSGELLPLDQRLKVQCYFEVEAAKALLKGMRVESGVTTLTNGVSYLDQSSVYPTFYLEADEYEGECEDSDYD